LAEDTFCYVLVIFHCIILLLDCRIEAAGHCIHCRISGCPYACLADGPISQRLSSVENRLQLLLYLVTELQAVRMTAINKPQLLAVKSTKQQKSVSFSLLLCYALVTLVIFKSKKC